MANELNVFAVDSSTLAQEHVEGQPFPEWAEEMLEDEYDMVIDYVFDTPPGIEWAGNFRHEYMALEDLEERILPHLENEEVVSAFNSGGLRLPNVSGDAETVAEALAVPSWQLLSRAEMAELRTAIQSAFDHDPEWASDEYTLSPDWHGLVEAFDQSDADLFVWAFWE